MVYAIYYKIADRSGTLLYATTPALPTNTTLVRSRHEVFRLLSISGELCRRIIFYLELGFLVSFGKCAHFILIQNHEWVPRMYPIPRAYWISWEIQVPTVVVLSGHFFCFILSTKWKQISFSKFCAYSCLIVCANRFFFLNFVITRSRPSSGKSDLTKKDRCFAQVVLMFTMWIIKYFLYVKIIK